MNRPCFKGRPIATLDALARALHFSPRQLRWAIERADTLYRHTKPIAKSDGSVRQTYDPAAPLKNIQRRINRNIFNRVMFPTYLQGGIRDRNNPRHCIANAKLHSGATIVINEDISSFFPSITKQQVRDIWQNLFHFPPEIAEALTILTTYQGILPQGAPTSSYLANLVLWRQEPELVTNLAARGIRYSRYVDDITLSSKRFLNNHKRVFDLVKDFGTSESPKSTRSSTTHWCPGRPGHPAFRHNIASSLRLHTGLPYDWTPRSDAPLGSPLAPSARRVSRVASRLPGTTRLRFALHGGQRRPASVRWRFSLSPACR